MEEWRGYLLGDESIFTFTRGCIDFRDPTAVFRLKQRGRRLAEIWVKGAFTIGREQRSELLAFLAGYFVAFGMRGPQRAMRANLVQWVFHRATELLASDDRFSKCANRFHEKYAIVQSRVMD